MAEEQEIQIMKNTTFELPLEKLSANPLPRSPALPSFTLSLKEVTKGGDWRFADGRETLQKQFNDDEELDYLEIKFTIGGDDPRIKGFDVYTQYSGINTVLIKHTSKSMWPCGIVFYAFNPDWDKQQDRILEVGEIRPTKLIGPASYRRATGLMAKSWPLEGSENSQITIGMCRGKSDEGGSSDTYGKFGETGLLSADLGHTLEFDLGNMSSGCALESHNPICTYEYTWKDYHPIPFASYNVWGRISDVSFGNLTPYCLAFAHYQTEWLKAGIIISRMPQVGVGGPYTYEIRCVRINGEDISSELITITGVLMKYEIGRFVLLSKQGENTWSIIPTSQLYWENAVDWIRRTSGF